MSEVVDKKVKGKIFSGYANYIKKKWGQNGIAMCSQHVGLDLNSIVDEKWYPNILSNQISAWVAENHGIEHCRKIGFETVAHAGVISYAARIVGINRVLEKGIQEFRDAINYGDINIDLRKDGATITLIDVCIDETDCEAWHGAFEGIMHITKAKGTVTQTECQFKGGANCIYELDWSKK